MGSGFSHAALAVFTTLAPMGAAAFIVLAAAIANGVGAKDGKANEEALRRFDKATTLPVALVIAGFVAAFFHLTAPLNAMYAFTGIGSSPLSNEVAVGVVFTVVMLVYWAWALTGKMGASIRRALAIVLAVFSVVFAVFCGLAYMMPTIPTWDNPFSVVQMVGFALLGGALIGALVCSIAKVDTARWGKAALVCAIVGVVVGVAGFGGFVVMAGSVCNFAGCALDAVPAAWGVVAAFAACGIIATALLAIALRRGHLVGYAAVGLALVVVGVFFARIVFYGLHTGLVL